MPLTATPPGRHLTPLITLPVVDVYSDARTHGYQGPSRNVRLPRVTTSGGGAIAKSEDGIRCVVAGKECLRILRFLEPSQSTAPEHKTSVGRGGHRIDASRNFWDGSGLKMDSASTDVVWAHGNFNNKILTSAKNGEVIVWDISNSGPSKYERRTKVHNRSINKLSVSHVVHHYCVTGSADGDMRVWDLRDMSKSLMRIHHPTSVRSVVFSPCSWQPLQAVVGLDNGSIYRWDLQMGQRGQLDRLPVAHSGPVMSLDWVCPQYRGSTVPGVSEGTDTGNGNGWIASGGLDRIVKVWDLTAPGSQTHIPHRPTYTLHTSFPVRRVLWRPSYECELAVVSNAEFGTGSGQDMTYAMAAAATTTKSPALSSPNLQSPSLGGAPARDLDINGIRGVARDAVEVWDVRRGWIAKWSVSGSAVEGGVTDIAFGDSHAMWAQHCSGMFSQIDLRNCIKPIDAIPRVAASWEASGSLAFVSDHHTNWEFPYDDIKPEHRGAVEEREGKVKNLGDDSYAPKSQQMGVFALNETDYEAFSKLARAYVIEGHDRRTVCELNASIAIQAGRFQAAQAWLLMGSLLIDLVPPLPPSPPALLPASKASISHWTSTMAASTGAYSFPAKADTSSHTNDGDTTFPQRISPGRTSIHKSDPSISSSTSRRLTPNSSTQSSPRHGPHALPQSAPRQLSYLGRRASVDANMNSVKQTSQLRRPSVSVHSTQSASPNDGAKSVSRHIGEGALDDSDSSGSGSENGHQAGGSSDEDESLRYQTATALRSTRVAPPHPSPLSRIAGQHRWTEDEDDRDENGSSPSPGSTDTDSSESTSPRKMRMSPSRRKVNRKRTTSLSSTVASLAANTFPRVLVRQESQSSIRTVTVGDLSMREEDYGKVAKDSGVRHSRRDDTEPVIPPLSTASSYNKRKSQTFSEAYSKSQNNGDREDGSSNSVPGLSGRRLDIVKAEERKFRRMGWDTLRATLDGFAAEGDVQTCAMLSIVASNELRISQGRANRFLDAYLELLSRLHLFTTMAYLRKYSQAEEIRQTTAMETTIYTSCGKCRKAIVMPAAQMRGGKPFGTYSYCLSCRQHIVNCSICHLPVRALLLQCSVCTHGGHQDCFKRYYMERPLLDMPSSSMLPEARIQMGRRGSSDTAASEDGAATDVVTDSGSILFSRTRKIMGHPCATGCGHICWVANRIDEDQ